jgi:hypothetical protein
VEKLHPHGVYEVLAQWDAEAGVWVAESKVPGLVAEADSPNVLVLIPELLELNGVPTTGPGVSMYCTNTKIVTS